MKMNLRSRSGSCGNRYQAILHGKGGRDKELMDENSIAAMPEIASTIWPISRERSPSLVTTWDDLLTST